MDSKNKMDGASIADVIVDEVDNDATTKLLMSPLLLGAAMSVNDGEFFQTRLAASSLSPVEHRKKKARRNKNKAARAARKRNRK